MDIRLLIVHLSTLLFPVFVFSMKDLNFETPDNPSITYTYRRFSEIEKQCSSVLPSPSELKPDDNRGNRMKKELSFLNGDWGQESGRAPLMPYDDSDPWKQYPSPDSFLELVSFWVMDVDPVRRSENMVSVSGIMEIGITRDSTLSYKPYNWSTNFHMGPGRSTLTILFEGVYIESEDNGGERLMCLLGTSTRPASNQVIDSLEPVNGYGYTYNQKPPLVQDDQIMLILRYPKIFALTTRGVTGELRSLNKKFDPKYFSGVHISSQLAHSTHSLKYQFRPEELLKACSPYPYQDRLVDEEVRMFKGEGFCQNLQNFLMNGMFNFVQNWESVGTNDLGRLGPFVFGKKLKATTNSHFEQFRLLVQDLQCESEIEQNKIETVKVSAVFRVVHSWEKRHISEERTGLSGMTLSAEGVWTSSSGQLCMVGCVGLVGAASNTCNSRICLYLPLTVSITQRNIVYGTISSIDKKEAHTTLLFEMERQPRHFIKEYEWNRNLKWSYKYSKVTHAGAFHTRSKPSILRSKIRESLLRYPSLHGSDNVSLSRLSDELSIGSRAILYPSNDAQAHQNYVEIEVLSLGSFFGRNWTRQNGQNLNVEKQIHSNPNTIEISGDLTATGVRNISLFMEGLYDPVVGEMYLIGCKDVQPLQKIIKNGTKLERGMDCQIEIKIDYPPRNARWLITPKVRISISSQRREEDSLHFTPISLETLTFPITYNEQDDDILFRKGIEGMLRILMLMTAILCLHWQLRYIKKQEEACAYISLVMLGVQALSYSIPLITGNAIIFKWKAFQSTNYKFRKYKDFEEIDMVIKNLLLYAIMVTLRLCSEVRASRVSLIHTHPGKKIRLPSDILVLFITLAIYILGFPILHVVREMNAVQGVPQSGLYSNTSNTIQKLLKLLGELNDYSGLIQDFFLLPQICSNMLWRIQFKPLSKSYYIGFTTMRVLFHAYDSIRDPVSHPKYFPFNEFENPSSDLNSRHGNIAIAITMILLAVILHIQQRCKPHQNVSQIQALKPVAEHEDHDALESELHERLLS